MAIEMNLPIEEEAEGDETIYKLFDEKPEVEELEDGSAVVRMTENDSPEEDPQFYENLAEKIDPNTLDDLALKYLQLFEKDQDARKERDKQYEEGLKRSGLGNEAPGGATFQGASKAVHPVIAEACVDFASRAMKEIMPPDGPVGTKILGEVTEQKQDVAERKRDFMNWQCTEQIEELRDELEQLTTQLPLGGSQYLKLWYDEQKKRPCAEFVPIDKILLPFSAPSFYTAQRVTEMQDMSEEEFERRINAGLYMDIRFVRATQEPEATAAQKANEKIEGKKSSNENIDGERRVYHSYVNLSIEDDEKSKGELAPYILMIDDQSHQVVGLYRNWEEGDEQMQKLDWLIEFKFIPWRGAYAIGLPQLIGGLSAALTGALRALLDSAHINNSPTMLKLKGARITGQSVQVEPTQVAEIEGAPGVDDIKKIAMPFPFNPPSPVLFELLGWITNAAKGVVTTSEEKIADISNNAPVGTTQALIEQGAAVYSSIHMRLHKSMRKMLMVLGRINRWWLEDMRRGDMVEDLVIGRQDFDRNTDIVPISDPHIFSETQRFAQNQALAALAKDNPDLFDRREVMKRILKQMKVPEINQVLPDVREVKEMNPALENVAMSLGQPTAAFPNQDHIAHIQTHLAYAMDPVYGMNPIIGQKFVPALLEHLKQHLTLWYLRRVDEYINATEIKDMDTLKVTPIFEEAQQLMSAVARHVHIDSQQTFEPMMPVLQQMMQIAQQMAPKPPVTPEVQALVQTSMAETQRRAQKDQGELMLKKEKQETDMAQAAQKIQADIAMNVEDNLTRQQIEAAKLAGENAALTQEQERTAMAAQEAAQRTFGA